MNYKKDIEVADKLISKLIYYVEIEEGSIDALRNCMASHKALGEAKDHRHAKPVAEKDKKIERLEKMLKAQGEESAKLSKDYYTLKQVSIYELALEIEATPASDNLDKEDYEAISEAIINKFRT